MIALSVLLFENIHRKNRLECKIITCEKVELAHTAREQELVEDLKNRTGLDIKRVEVGHIDYLKDIFFVKVYYSSNKPDNTINGLTKIKGDNCF